MCANVKTDEQQENLNCLQLQAQANKIKAQIDKEMAEVVLPKEIKERIIQFICLPAE